MRLIFIAFMLASIEDCFAISWYKQGWSDGFIQGKKYCGQKAEKDAERLKEENKTLRKELAILRQKMQKLESNKSQKVSQVVSFPNSDASDYNAP